MATKQPKDTQKKRIRRTETVRERSAKGQKESNHPMRLRKVGGTVASPLKRIAAFGRVEFYLPMPDNKVGRFLNKRRSFMPRYFINAWKELRQVKWPTARETTKLTIAVFVFAIIFGVVIALVDYGLDYIFKQVIL